MKPASEKLIRYLRNALVFLGVAMVLYHMAATQYMFFGSYEHQNVHLGFALVLIFLRSVIQARNPWRRLMGVSLVALSLVCAFYIGFSIEHLGKRGFQQYIAHSP